jgi:MFS family permease
VAALVSVGYVVLSSSETRWIWPAFVLSAIVGSAGAFTNPARQSMVPQIVSRAMIQNAAIFGTMAFMATLQFAGPALGGVLVDGPGLSFAFGTEVGLLAAAAMLFARIATDRPIPTGRTVFRDLADGIRYIRGQPTILSMIALARPGDAADGPSP